MKLPKWITRQAWQQLELVFFWVDHSSKHLTFVVLTWRGWDVAAILPVKRRRQRRGDHLGIISSHPTHLPVWPTLLVITSLCTHSVSRWSWGTFCGSDLCCPMGCRSLPAPTQPTACWGRQPRKQRFQNKAAGASRSTQVCWECGMRPSSRTQPGVLSKHSKVNGMMPAKKLVMESLKHGFAF